MRQRFIQLDLLTVLCLTLISLTILPAAIHAADPTKPLTAETDEYMVLDTTKLDLLAGLVAPAHIFPRTVS